MLNQSDFLTSVKMDLGIYGLSLPFEDVNQIIMETIRLKTIPTFSQFIPDKLRVDLDINAMTVIKANYEESIYELPDVFGDRRIIGVLNIRPRNKLLGSTFLSPMQIDSVDIYNSFMMSQANADLYSAVAPPFTFKFEQPNVLYLYNMNTIATEITVDIMLEHMPNLSTIKNTTWESFNELALIDIKKMLFNSMKHYREMQSAYGNINLRIDDWENADNERKELIEKWRGIYHLDLPSFMIV